MKNITHEYEHRLSYIRRNEMLMNIETVFISECKKAAEPMGRRNLFHSLGEDKLKFGAPPEPVRRLHKQTGGL